MNDARLRQPRVPVGEAERAAWDHNLAVLERAMASPDGDSRARANRLVRALDRDVEQLCAKRRLRALSVGEISAKGAPASELLWLDDLIAEKSRRRRQLALLEKSTPARAMSSGAATPEALSKPARRDPVQALADQGRLDDDQVRAAMEIRLIFEAVSRSLDAGSGRLGRVGNRPAWRAGDMPRSLAGARRRRFLPWAEHLRASDPLTLDVVLRIAVFGLSVFAVSRRHRLNWAKCLERFCLGLDLYWDRRAAIAGSPGIPRRGCP